ncbi:serine hydrolase domain-containing protein [Enterococcus cecorum]|uniref:serine hydrolase domain-containing protein n=1 Tax=Enterococcus cecorum TaxID=44008 RepID=UPI00148C5505|nr:serine hydrolase domain-containing protein [Enterococcus cecorum]
MQENFYPKTQAKIQEYLNEKVFPGVCYAIIDQEKMIHKHFGYASLIPEKRVMSGNTLFDVASLTKVVCTTTMILKLMEQGLIEIDQPLKKYLPAYGDESITLRHLLTHTADIVTYIPNRDQLNQQELMQAYLTLRAGDNLGKVVKYTDAGTILLGFMLEAIFQKPVTTIFKEEIFEPLQMTESQFPPLDMHYSIAATEDTLCGQTHDPKARVLAEHAGNAGLFTNLADLLKFTQMYLNEGQLPDGRAFLQRETIAPLYQDQTPSKEGKRSLGWDLRYGFLFHTGYTGTFLCIDPKLQQAFIFLSNRVHPYDFRQEYLEKRDELIAIYLKEKEMIIQTSL